MKLYVRQKVFSWTDRFSVTDEYGDPRYYVKGQLFSLGKKLRIYDESGENIAEVHEELFRLLPRYRVDIYGRKAASIVKEVSFLRPRYRIEGTDWRIEGDILAHDYEILDGRGRVASIHKAWLKWGDYYELNVADSGNKLLAMSVALAIDCVIDNEEKKKDQPDNE